MALKTSVTGSGILTGYEKTTRRITKWTFDVGVAWYDETTATETREWTALTSGAASAAVSAGTGESSISISGTGIAYKNSQSEDTRTIGSYRYICSAEIKTVTAAAT